jgi:hypothetical protein
VPVQNALLNIILSGAFISSVPLAQDLQSQFPANMLKGEESFFPSSSGCYLGCSELRVVTEWCCPTWKNTQKKVPAFFFFNRDSQQRAVVMDNFPCSFFSKWGILKFSL